MSYKIPENNIYQVSNASDLTPNIQFTKNIDMDISGYLRLSPPMPTVTNDSIISDFGVFTDAIRIGGTSDYKILTDDAIYDLDLPSLTVTLDASAPAGNGEGRFVGFKGGDWYLNTSGDIYSLQYSAGTVWDIENTDTVDYLEAFVSQNSLCGSTSSSVLQYNNTTDFDGTTPPSTNSGTTMSIPANFGVTAMAYSNYRMGVGTKNNTGGNGYFFTWDSSTALPSQGFPIYANMVLDVIAYKNSWAILTSIGQLLYFNGGGFDVLGNLPCYYDNYSNWIVFGGSYSHGRSMYTDGDIIYINVPATLEANEDDTGIMKGFYSGVWCYDPEIKSLYHRYGLAHSLLLKDDGNASATVFTYVGHGLETGDKIRVNDTVYYAVRVTADTYKVSDTYDLAVLGTATSDNVDGTKTFIQRTDWSQLQSGLNTNTGACIKFDNGETLAGEGLLPLFAGLGLWDKSLSYNNTINVLAPVFDNIGTIQYNKIKAEEYEDIWNSINIKHSPLTDGDKIVVKYKIKDNYKQIAVGEADDSSPETYITWVTSTSFTTTEDMTLIEVGDEVEFFGGAGAGSTAHVVSTTDNAGTWTVVVDEAIRGGVASNRSTCVFDSFKKLGVITKDTEGNPLDQVRLGLELQSKWIQVKLELRGNNVKIEEVIIQNTPVLPTF